MPTIKSEFNQFVSSVGSTVGGIGDTISNFFRGITSQVSATVGSLISGSVVGINVNRIDEMRDSIRTYTNEIETHLEEVHLNTDPSGAFADPEMQAAVKAYVGGVMEACRAYTSQLLKFSDILYEIKVDYEAKQAAQSSTLRTAGAEVGNVERYTEKY